MKYMRGRGLGKQVTQLVLRDECRGTPLPSTCRTGVILIKKIKHTAVISILKTFIL